MTTEATTEHKHSFPCNPPGGTFLHPGPCECGKTCEQDEADRLLTMALDHLERAYGTVPVAVVRRDDAEMLLKICALYAPHEIGTGKLPPDIAPVVARVGAAVEGRSETAAACGGAPHGERM